MAILAALPKLMRLAMTAPYAQGASVPSTYTQVGFSRFADGIQREPLDTGRNVGFGTLSKPVTRVVENRRILRPTGSFVPTVGEWQMFLEWILGANGIAPGASGNDSSTEYLYLPANEVKRRRMIWNDTQNVYQMNEVACTKAVFTSEQGSELTLDVEMVGHDWSTVAFPTGLQQDFEASLYATASTLSFPDMSPALTSVPYKKFVLTIENRIDPERFFNSLYLSEPIKYDRVITVSVDIPYGVQKELRATSSYSNGVELECKFVLGNKSLRLNLAHVIAWEDSLQHTVADTPSETLLPWTGMCYAPIDSVAVPPPATQIGSEIAAYLDVSA